MQVDYIIVGQGISGTFLGFELEKANHSFVVIDNAKPFAASRIASGVINPVTGRRVVKTWIIEALMPFAWEAYIAIGAKLGITCIEEKSVIDFFGMPQMRLAFLERLEQDSEYLLLPGNENDLHHLVNYSFGYGIIHPAYLVNLPLLLPTYRKHLVNNNWLLEEHFDIEKLAVRTNGVDYKDISASKIIFCDGAEGFSNPYFKQLPYAANKGEAVLVEVNDFPVHDILKKGYSLVPWSHAGQENIFWLGSTYLWEFNDEQPTKGFRQFAENWLRQTIKADFKILDHMAAVRPATLERRPFVGIHPNHPNIAIFNGMGTKGCSLAPFFANQLVSHLLFKTPVMPEVDVQRFRKILNRG